MAKHSCFSLYAVKNHGRPTLFTITLSGNNVVYFAGSNIEGKVVLELAEQKKVQGISIMFSAKAYMHYTKHEGGFQEYR